MPSDGKPVDNGDKDLRRETCGKNIPSRGKTTPTPTPSVYVRQYSQSAKEIILWKPKCRRAYIVWRHAWKEPLQGVLSSFTSSSYVIVPQKSRDVMTVSKCFMRVKKYMNIINLWALIVKDEKSDIIRVKQGPTWQINHVNYLGQIFICRVPIIQSAKLFQFASYFRAIEYQTFLFIGILIY